MTEDLGTASSPQVFRGEQLYLEPRTSDPSDTQQGEAWLRTDLAPETDQIATLRFDNGSGTWDIPIYATGTSESGIEEVLRVPVGGTTGFIPVYDSGEFQNLRFQHGGATLQLHDRLFTMPDSDIWYSVDEGSGSTLNDSHGTTDANLNNTYSWVSDTDAYNEYYVDVESGYADVGDTSVISYDRDFSLGVQINVESSLDGSESNIVSWSDGSRIFGLGFDVTSGRGIGATAYDGSSRVDEVNHDEPSAPYQVGLLLTWDSSNESLELYLDGDNPHTFSNTYNPISANSGFVFGDNTGFSANYPEGIDAIGIWDGEQIAPDTYFSVL